MNNTKEIDITNLPEDVKRELLDFYEFLLNKYTVSVSLNTSDKSELSDKKKHFIESIEKHSYNLPKNFKFDREELYERKGRG